ncbi:MAG: Zn-dependent hydrolase, partial [Marmoricola sp.]|nr:Zn-dependent hydrolase [Marmoricola sp.]
NELENQLDYTFGDTLPAPGTTLEVAPGVRWIRMALPFALDHINLWLLRDECDAADAENGSGAKIQGWTVVDCCVDRQESRAQWGSIFADALQGLPILRVIVTHMHPDHIGLAHWLCAKWNAPLWISATDYYVAKINTLGTSANGGEAAAQFFRTHGLDDAAVLDAISVRCDYYADLVPTVPPRLHRMQDGDTVRMGGRSWHCISGFGHAPEHIALHCAEAGLLIGGDMMLPRISTNVSVYDTEPEANALQQFLDSIDRFAPLAADTLTLPSHGKPFRGLHTRIAQLHAHHAQHLAAVLAAAAATGGVTAADVLPVLFRRQLDVHQTTFAMGEAIAHLHKLWRDGDLRRVTGARGMLRFCPTPQGLAKLKAHPTARTLGADLPVST